MQRDFATLALYQADGDYMLQPMLLSCINLDIMWIFYILYNETPWRLLLLYPIRMVFLY